MSITWKTVQKKVNDLIPAEYNPRQLTAEQAKELQKSLEKFGLAEIPAINTDGTILAGHQRITVLKRLGRGEQIIDVRVPERELTDAEAREYNLRSNKNIGEWDFDKLFEFDEELLKEAGFDNAVLKSMVGDFEVSTGETERKPEKKTTCPNCSHIF